MNRYELSENVKLAFTHPSYTNENNVDDSNQRLEFFGDAILDMIISEYLYLSVNKNEGHLTRLRASIVKKESLSKFAKKIQLQEKIKVGKCEDVMKESVLADAFEALIAALYLDKGYEYTKQYVFDNFANEIKEILSSDPIDYKSLLQQKMQENGPCRIRYSLDKYDGKDHDRTFYVSLYVNNRLLSSAKGKSKKKAEMLCAKKALEDEK